jgi:hypothetical protein
VDESEDNVFLWVGNVGDRILKSLCYIHRLILTVLVSVKFTSIRHHHHKRPCAVFAEKKAGFHYYVILGIQTPHSSAKKKAQWIFLTVRIKTYQGFLNPLTFFLIYGTNSTSIFAAVADTKYFRYFPVDELKGTTRIIYVLSNAFSSFRQISPG